MGMKKTAVFFAVAIFLLTSCSGSEAKKQESAALSIWLPEWQLKSTIENIDRAAQGLQSMRIFGAYFNEKDEPFLTESAQKMHASIYEKYKGDHTLLLTIINDYVVEGRPSVQKDSTLLHRLLKDKEARKKHIANILALAERYPVHGIEIDYEKIAKEDTEYYILFLEELYDALKERNLLLEVVVVPSFPFEKPLPNGPTYTVMAYNVHGYHSGPGAKATYAFLDDLLKKVSKSNQKFAIAFATGGFAWPSSGKIKALTGEEAENIMKQKSLTTVRDAKSDAVSFRYTEAGVDYEAWYADATTLQNWVKYVREKDPTYQHFVLWRAGGLTTSTIEWIAQKEDVHSR